MYSSLFRGWPKSFSILTSGSRVLPEMNPRNSWTSLKRLFDGALFAIFGRFSPISVKNWIFKKGHFREIHSFFDFDARVSLATYFAWAVVQGRHRSAGFPSKAFLAAGIRDLFSPTAGPYGLVQVESRESKSIWLVHSQSALRSRSKLLKPSRQGNLWARQNISKNPLVP